MKKSIAEKGKIDMLEGPIWNKIPRFAAPVAATGMLEQLFNASDIAVVGNFAGELKTVAVAAVGANSPVVGLIVNLFVGISLGANVVIANSIGSGDHKSVHSAVKTSITMALLFGLAIMAIGEAVSSPLMELLNVPPEVLPYAVTYLRIYLIGLPVILLYNFEAAIFRSVGETRVPLIALALSGIVNVILNLFFVIVCHMSVEGVAIATVISNALSSLLLYYKLRTTELDIHVEKAEFGIEGETFKRILRIGLPAGIQSSVFALANIVIQSAINSLGTVVMAASSAAFNIEVFTFYLLNSFSQACTTFTGQNYGAGKKERCKKTLLLCLLEGSVTMILAITLVVLTGHELLRLFTNDPEVIRVGYIRVMTIVPAHFFSLFYEVMSGYLRGYGISLLPAICTMLSVCGIRIAWVHTVFPMFNNFESIMWVYPVSLGTNAILIFLVLLYYHPSRRKDVISKI